jgi:hypothetical protein
MPTLTQQEASRQIAEKLETAKRALADAQNIADENGVGFSWSGPEYGMGGYYTAKPNWDSSGCSDEEWSASTRQCEGAGYGWSSSSSRC